MLLFSVVILAWSPEASSVPVEAKVRAIPVAEAITVANPPKDRESLIRSGEQVDRLRQTGRPN